MCSITPETANVGSSYNRMRGPGIGCWFSDRSNCSHWSLTLTLTSYIPIYYIYWSLYNYAAHAARDMEISSQLLNFRALKHPHFNKIHLFNFGVWYFVCNLKWCLWIFTQNTISIHWKIWFVYNVLKKKSYRYTLGTVRGYFPFGSRVGIK